MAGKAAMSEKVVCLRDLAYASTVEQQGDELVWALGWEGRSDGEGYEIHRLVHYWRCRDGLEMGQWDPTCLSDEAFQFRHSNTQSSCVSG
jgi:hypothetical protein